MPQLDDVRGFPDETVGAAELLEKLEQLTELDRGYGAELTEQGRAKAITTLLEEAAILWPLLATGETWIDVHYDRGKVRRVYVHHGPVQPARLGLAYPRG